MRHKKSRDKYFSLINKKMLDKYLSLINIKKKSRDKYLLVTLRKT